ncbi:MAG TPA: hypothetical protein VKB93_15370 [Thermoanaerobaculia bacterium]|nr:hypothetical protein [Thermoanaerobaculia bacterium]
MNVTTIALWALVIALGIQVGAGIFETRVLVPLWSSNPPASLTEFYAQPLRPDSGRRMWVILSPMTTLISVVNFVLALMSRTPWRQWWLASAACSLAVMVATFAYFVPALMSFARSAEHPSAMVADQTRRWVILNYLRALVLILGWVAGLKAFASGV